MNFRKKLTSKLAIVATLVVIASLVIALVAIPAVAGNQAPASPAGVEVSNAPPPVVIPKIINYQGYLTDSGGNPINGTLEMTFSIYEVDIGGTPLWTETQSVNVTNGLFNVLLGSLNPIDGGYLTGQSYLAIQVGADPEMMPRQQMVSVAYAFHAERANDADSLDAMDSADFVAVAGDTMTGQLYLPADGLVAGTDQLVLTDGKVGIGTAGPVSKLDVQGSISGFSEGDPPGVSGTHVVGNYGQLGTLHYGVYGSSSAGSGVYGSSIDGYGVHGSSNTSAGVYGLHSDSGNLGLLGTDNEGVLGHGYSYTGVHGTSYDGYGVWGDSVDNVAVYGESGVKIGVYGRQFNSGNYGYLGTSNEGVYGEHKSSGNFGQLGTSNEGVSGYHQSSGNYGRLGTENDGVTGRSTVDTGSGVYGNNTAAGYGVFGRNISSSNYGYLGGSYEGVYGRHDASGNYGRLGTNDEGVLGYSSSGYGVQGYYSGNGNYGLLGSYYQGVYGYSAHSVAAAVHGKQFNGNYGVLATSDEGARGYNYGSGNYGILGTSDEGVFGFSSSGYGVRGYGGTYDFYADGPGTNYGPFTGGHEVKLASSFPEDIKPGLIVSVTGETQVRTEEGEISYSSTLPTVQLADIANDSKVFGVIIAEAPLHEDHWYESGEGERFGIVNALGEGRVWVTNINGDIEAGDYITTSGIAGYGQKQEDDLLHSYTLGKAIETVDWNQVTETVGFNGQTYKAYPIAVVYTSG